MLSLPALMCYLPSAPISDLSMVIWKSEWDLLDVAFMFVAPTDLFFIPIFMTSLISSTHFTAKKLKSLT